MPEFTNVLSGMDGDRRLKHDEMVRAIRFAVAAEYEAVQMYRQLAHSIDDEKAIAVLNEVSEEELVHAGEFLRLLKEISPNEERLYALGSREVEQIWSRLPKG